MRSMILCITTLLISVCFNPLNGANQLKSIIQEVNNEGMQHEGFGTYLSFIKTQEGHIYGVEDFFTFSSMEWEGGDTITIENVADVIQDEMFPKSKVLLTLKNQQKDQNVTVVLLKHPTSMYLHSSIEAIYAGQGSLPPSDIEESSGDNISPIQPRPDVETPIMFKVKLFDGRIYGILSFRNSIKENWNYGDAIEEDHAVKLVEGNKCPEVIIILRNLSLNSEAEAVLLKDAS
jgi:hypothetical protein